MEEVEKSFLGRSAPAPYAIDETAQDHISGFKGGKNERAGGSTIPGTYIMTSVIAAAPWSIQRTSYGMKASLMKHTLMFAATAASLQWTNILLIMYGRDCM